MVSDEVQKLSEDRKSITTERLVSDLSKIELEGLTAEQIAHYLTGIGWRAPRLSTEEVNSMVWDKLNTEAIPEIANPTYSAPRPRRHGNRVFPLIMRGPGFPHNVQTNQ